MRQMAKITSAILVLRNSSAAAWTPQLDSAMNTWVNKYIGWVTGSALGKAELSFPK
jgi:hypothetical protein